MSRMEFGIVQRPKSGRNISGDAYLVKEEEEATLICLVDGLGSGEAAAEAAQAAIRCVEVSSTLPLSDIMAKCHQALRGTRGAVMALLRVSLAERTITYVGVGNIGIHVRSTALVKPISRNGIVGYRLPSLQEFTYPYTPGDLFVLHTDGISSRLTLDDTLWTEEAQDVQTLANAIDRSFGKENDDVTVLVAR
ncbi:MAG: SpoIIE family protein phosphatase [Anaerolineae bacterium]|nr:SpoIIE family protein phosphatase [Anaerolineae bacterium]